MTATEIRNRLTAPSRRSTPSDASWPRRTLVGVLFAAPLAALIITTVVQVHRLWCGEPPVSLADLAKEGGREAKERGTP